MNVVHAIQCRPGPQELKEWSKQLVQKPPQPDMTMPADSALDYLRMLPPQSALPDLYGPTNLSRQRSWEHNRVRSLPALGLFLVALASGLN